MNGATAQVNILLHGLFFMRLNPLNNNLEVIAPDIPDHHFVGGVRGARRELSGTIDLTYLTGKQDPPSLVDLKGSVFQFSRADTDIQRFTGDLSKFRGTIVLPWPIAFHSLRCDDITNAFPYVHTSKVGTSIELNARRKGFSKLGAVTLLQYTSNVSSGSALLQNMHYYNQPCTTHKVPDVNKDLDTAAACFLPYDPSKKIKSFDLQLIPSAVISSTPIGQNGCNVPNLGTTPEDELSLDEETLPDVLAICPLETRALEDGDGDPGVSPANCPTIFVMFS